MASLATFLLDDADALRFLHGDTIETWQAFHDALSTTPALWDALVRSEGAWRGTNLELGTCLVCRSTFGRSLGEPDATVVREAFRRAERTAMGVA